MSVIGNIIIIKSLKYSCDIIYLYKNTFYKQFCEFICEYNLHSLSIGRECYVECLHCDL